MSARAASGKAVITARDLCKDYAYYKKDAGLRGSIKNLFHRETLYRSAVKNLSFRIAKGTITGLIGLNGAGKTTTLKMLAGLIMPTRGQIEVLGYRPFDKKRDYLRRISMVMGNRSQLWWDLPVLPIYFYSTPYMQSARVNGIYISPRNWVFFRGAEVAE